MFHSATLKLTVWYLLILMSVGLMFSIIIYQIASSEVDSRLENLRQTFQPEATIMAVKAQSSLFTSLVYMNLLFLAIGGIASYLMARRTLEPIERTHEAQSRFASDASHELRTPLAAMKTELEVALRDPSLTKKEMKELLESNLEEVNKLSQISQTLLLLSRLEHTGLSTSKIVINDIVRRSVERMDRGQGRIIYSPVEKPLYIQANKVSIEELVTILIDNALKYSPKNSKVRVDLRRKGKKAQLQVHNTGRGIKPEELPYIFDRFYQVDESRSNSGKTGFGLGLSLAKKIIEVHQGDLSVSSQPGKKTIFTVSLPLFEPPKKRTIASEKIQRFRR